MVRGVLCFLLLTPLVLSLKLSKIERPETQRTLTSLERRVSEMNQLLDSHQQAQRKHNSWAGRRRRSLKRPERKLKIMPRTQAIKSIDRGLSLVEQSRVRGAVEGERDLGKSKVLTESQKLLEQNRTGNVSGHVSVDSKNKQKQNPTVKSLDTTVKPLQKSQLSVDTPVKSNRTVIGSQIQNSQEIEHNTVRSGLVSNKKNSKSVHTQSARKSSVRTVKPVVKEDATNSQVSHHTKTASHHTDIASHHTKTASHHTQTASHHTKTASQVQESIKDSLKVDKSVVSGQNLGNESNQIEDDVDEDMEHVKKLNLMMFTKEMVKIVETSMQRWYGEVEIMYLGEEYEDNEVKQQGKIILNYGVEMDLGEVEGTQMLLIRIGNKVFENSLRVQILKSIDDAMKDYVNEFLNTFMIKAVQVVNDTDDVAVDVGILLQHLYSIPEAVEELNMGSQQLEGSNNSGSLQDHTELQSQKSRPKLDRESHSASFSQVSLDNKTPVKKDSKLASIKTGSRKTVPDDVDIRSNVGSNVSGKKKTTQVLSQERSHVSPIKTESKKTILNDVDTRSNVLSNLTKSKKTIIDQSQSNIVDNKEIVKPVGSQIKSVVKSRKTGAQSLQSTSTKPLKKVDKSGNKTLRYLVGSQPTVPLQGGNNSNHEQVQQSIEKSHQDTLSHHSKSIDNKNTFQKDSKTLSKKSTDAKTPSQSELGHEGSHSGQNIQNLEQAQVTDTHSKSRRLSLDVESHDWGVGRGMRRNLIQGGEDFESDFDEDSRMRIENRRPRSKIEGRRARVRKIQRILNLGINADSRQVLKEDDREERELAGNTNKVNKTNKTKSVVKSGATEDARLKQNASIPRDVDLDTAKLKSHKTGQKSIKSGNLTNNSVVVSPKIGQKSVKSGIISQKSGQLSRKTGQNSVRTGVISPKSGKLSPKTVQNSVRSGVISHKSGKLSPKSGKLSPKTGQLSQKTASVRTDNLKSQPIKSVRTNPDLLNSPIKSVKSGNQTGQQSHHSELSVVGKKTVRSSQALSVEQRESQIKSNQTVIKNNTQEVSQSQHSNSALKTVKGEFEVQAVEKITNYILQTENGPIDLKEYYLEHELESSNVILRLYQGVDTTNESIKFRMLTNQMNFDILEGMIQMDSQENFKLTLMNSFFTLENIFSIPAKRFIVKSVEKAVRIAEERLTSIRALSHLLIENNSEMILDFKYPVAMFQRAVYEILGHHFRFILGGKDPLSCIWPNAQDNELTIEFRDSSYGSDVEVTYLRLILKQSGEEGMEIVVSEAYVLEEGELELFGKKNYPRESMFNMFAMLESLIREMVIVMKRVYYTSIDEVIEPFANPAYTTDVTSFVGVKRISVDEQLPIGEIPYAPDGVKFVFVLMPVFKTDFVWHTVVERGDIRGHSFNYDTSGSLKKTETLEYFLYQTADTKVGGGEDSQSVGSQSVKSGKTVKSVKSGNMSASQMTNIGNRRLTEKKGSGIWRKILNLL